MAIYKELKEAFYNLIRNLNNQISSDNASINRYNRIDATIVECLGKEEDDDIKPEKLIQLKNNFPSLKEDFEIYEKMGKHNLDMRTNVFESANPVAIMSDVKTCAKLYAFPSQAVIEEIEKNFFSLPKLRSINIGRFYGGITSEEVKRLHKRELMDVYNIIYQLRKIYLDIGDKIVEKIDVELEKINPKELSDRIARNKEKLQLVKQFNAMFSNNKLITKFKDDAEYKSFVSLVKELFDEDKCKEILDNVLSEQNKEEEKVVTITFDSLDLEKFNEEERNVIRDIHQIIEEEASDNNSLNTKDKSYEEILMIYQNAPISSILVDIKNNLINRIYDNKEAVINIFRYVISLYQKAAKNRIRENQIIEFERIKNDFGNIIAFVNRTYTNRDKAFRIVEELQGYLKDIESNHLPMLSDLINTNYDADDYYDKEFERIISSFKVLIKAFKKEMGLYNSTSYEQESIKENTDNLVFCLSNNIELPTEGHQKEFVGTVLQLELKSIVEIRNQLGRKSLSKIKKSEYSEDSLINYLENINNAKLHFVPYRYSSESNYRTGLIRFQPSEVVKKHLEERYGLSKQSAFYGVFKVICIHGNDHSEYAYLREYVYDNLQDIIDLASLFASDKPDLDKLDEEIDKLLSYKKGILDMINNKGNRK